MLQWIISSCVLIAVVLLLRLVLKGRISLRLQYALWALVLVRLLLPVSIGSSSISVSNFVPKQELTDLPSVNVVVDLPEAEDTLPPVSVEQLPRDEAVIGDPAEVLPTTQIQDDPVERPGDLEPAKRNPLTVTQIHNLVWGIGAVVVGLWFFTVNLRMHRRLRATRKPVAAENCSLPVYVTDGVDTPCLFGLLRPAIYLTRESLADPVTLRYALIHEQVHRSHGDHLWAILRCLCLAIHWYNPLVWLAALVSRRDAELACDEAVLRRLGEADRAPYGRALLQLTCRKRPALLSVSTTMTGSAKSIRERISVIVKKPKMAVYTLVAVLLIAAIAVGCTFTGGKKVEPKQPENEVTNPEEAIYTLFDATGEMIFNLNNEEWSYPEPPHKMELRWYAREFAKIFRQYPWTACGEIDMETESDYFQILSTDESHTISVWDDKVRYQYGDVVHCWEVNREYKALKTDILRSYYLATGGQKIDDDHLISTEGSAETVVDKYLRELYLQHMIELTGDNFFQKPHIRNMDEYRLIDCGIDKITSDGSEMEGWICYAFTARIYFVGSAEKNIIAVGIGDYEGMKIAYDQVHLVQHDGQWYHVGTEFCDPVEELPADQSICIPYDIPATEDVGKIRDRVPVAYKVILEKVWGTVIGLSTPESQNLSPLYRKCSSPSDVRYALMDLDGNGQEELILSGKDVPYIYDLFTIRGGEVIHLVSSGGERNTYYLYEDGRIENQWTASSATGGHDYYQLKDGELQFVERITMDPIYAVKCGRISNLTEANEDNSFFCATSPEYAHYEPITFEEALTAIDTYKTEWNRSEMAYTSLLDYTEDIIDYVEDIIEYSSQNDSSATEMPPKPQQIATPEETVYELFDAGGAMSIWLELADGGCTRAFSLEDRLWAENFASKMERFEWTATEKPAAENEGYYVLLQSPDGEQRMKLYPLEIQYENGEQTLCWQGTAKGSFYSTGSSGSLAKDIRSEYDAMEERYVSSGKTSWSYAIEGTAEEAVKAYVDRFDPALPLTPGSSYAITDSFVIDWTIYYVSEDGNSVGFEIYYAFAPFNTDPDNNPLAAGGVEINVEKYGGMWTTSTLCMLQRSVDGLWYPRVFSQDSTETPVQSPATPKEAFALLYGDTKQLRMYLRLNNGEISPVLRLSYPAYYEILRAMMEAESWETVDPSEFSADGDCTVVLLSADGRHMLSASGDTLLYESEGQRLCWRETNHIWRSEEHLDEYLRGRIFNNEEFAFSRISFSCEGTAEDAARYFVEEAFAEQYLNLTRGHWYAYSEYRLMDWEILQTNEEGTALVLGFTHAFVPANSPLEYMIIGNGGLGTGEYEGMVYTYREIVLRQLSDGKWYCVGGGTGGLTLRDGF